MAHGSPQRKLVAILAADIVGYSRLMEEDEAATVRELKGHQAVILPAVGLYGGRVIDTAGDGILAEFPSVINATECAVEIQTVMATRNEAQPESRRMRFRIGINLGDVIQDETRIYGDGVNVAARLQTYAEPGSIVVSGAVAEQIVTPAWRARHGPRRAAPVGTCRGPSGLSPSRWTTCGSAPSATRQSARRAVRRSWCCRSGRTSRTRTTPTSPTASSTTSSMRWPA